MDFELSEHAVQMALISIESGEPIAPAFQRITLAVLPSLPARAAECVASLALQRDIEALCDQVRSVLTHEPPSMDINGLWFGLAEMLWAEEGAERAAENASPEFTLYIAGSTAFDPEVEDWPCGPEWWPEERYFDIPSFEQLSALCGELDEDQAWLVATGLIEPLSILLIAEACRRIDPGTLLGNARFRGVGSGFDGGDLRDIGVITRNGFASPALLKPAKQKPAPRKTAPKKTAKKAKAAKAKPIKAKPSKTMAARTTKTAARKTAKKATKAGVKKAVKRSTSKKKATSRTGAPKKPKSNSRSKPGRAASRR
mgnify:CR=1 FL=1